MKSVFLIFSFLLTGFKGGRPPGCRPFHQNVFFSGLQTIGLMLVVLMIPYSAMARDISQYTIVLEEEAPRSVHEAAETLREYVEQSTGHELPIAHRAARRMIVLGENRWSEAAGVNAEGLPWEGVRIRTVDDNVYIVGRDLPADERTPGGGKSLGTYFGVLTFLENVLGVRWLMPFEHGTLVPPHEKLQIPDLDRVDEPGFNGRRIGGMSGSWGTLLDEWLLKQKLGPARERRTGGSLNLAGNHAWHVLFPSPGSGLAKLYDDNIATYKEHPEWFEAAADGSRIRPPSGGGHWGLCPTAEGLAEEMARRVGILHEHTGRRYISISPSDGAPRCHCQTCQSRLEPYRPEFHGDRNGLSWTPIILDQYKRIAEIVGETHPEVKVFGLIYQRYGQPPIEKVEMPDNFLGDLAPHPWNYGPQRNIPEVNEQFRNVLEAWNKSIDDKNIWMLELYMRQHAGAPLPLYPDLLDETMERLLDHEYEGVFLYASPDFGANGIMNYVLPKMMWSPETGVRVFMEDFCRAAYGDGGGSILAMYELINERMIQWVRANSDLNLTYILAPEMLRDVYAMEWDRITELYLDAEERVQTPGERARLEMLGQSLQRLYYHLLVYGFLESDPRSPFHVEPAEYESANRHLGWSRGLKRNVEDLAAGPWPENRFFSNLSYPAHLKPAAALPDETKGEKLPRLQYHQEAILFAPEDGPIRVELEYETRERSGGGEILPAIPYYTVLDEDLQSIHVGIARENRYIEFPGEAGRHYWLLLTETGMHRGMPYTLDANVPYVLGDKIFPTGMRLLRNEAPLYFHVPEHVENFELEIQSGAPTHVEVFSPTGQSMGSFKGNYRILEFSSSQEEGVREAKQDGWNGHWKIVFHRPITRGTIKQDTALSGFFTVDPEHPLVVERRN